MNTFLKLKKKKKTNVMTSSELFGANWVHDTYTFTTKTTTNVDYFPLSIALPVHNNFFNV